MSPLNILIVGAGFSGATVARFLAEAGHQVTIIDKRNHVAGNAHDFINHHNIRVHSYGPHIFHTSNDIVVEFLSRFTQWIPYRHKVRALLPNGEEVVMPPNKETAKIVGPGRIIEVLFKPYTEKMWGLNIETIDPEVLNRVSARNDNNEYYFPNDTFQAMPENGYTTLIENILTHEKINIELSKPFNHSMEERYDHIFNSMPIDEYFNFELGELPYRSIRFENFDIPHPNINSVPTINFTHSGPHSRVTEWKKFPNHGENEYWTTLTFEIPCDYKENNFERYYPVKDINRKNRNLYKIYTKMTPQNMTFIGRCGLYAYLDMHQAISSSMATALKFIKATNNQQ